VPSFSDDLRVMLAPAASYRRLVEQPPATGARAVLRRPALVALVVAALVTLGNAGQLLPSLLVGSILSWSWVPALQLAIATPLIAAARRRRVPLSAAIDLFFMGHLPWSLWLMALAGWLLVRFPQGISGGFPVRGLLATALAPVVWTWVLTAVYCRTVLALPRWACALWVLAYQAVLWGCTYLYVGAVTYRIWPFALYRSFLG
jgi:hypothetical protein